MAARSLWLRGLEQGAAVKAYRQRKPARAARLQFSEPRSRQCCCGSRHDHRRARRVRARWRELLAAIPPSRREKQRSRVERLAVSVHAAKGTRHANAAAMRACGCAQMRAQPEVQASRNCKCG